jgi:xanthine dehydrogenase accessory factor
LAVGPVPHLSVFGSDDNAVAVARLAAQVGFHVTVRTSDDSELVRGRFRDIAALDVGATRDLVERFDRFAGPFAVVMTHDEEQDSEILAALLDSRARYIGVVAPERRTQRLLAQIAYGSPISPERLRNVRSPVDANEDDPEAVARAIIASAQAVHWRAQRAAAGSGEHPIAFVNDPTDAAVPLSRRAV